MFRVLIVDDDFTARTSFKTMIDWEKHGFTICGEAANGKNAIPMIQDSRPNLVITDMNMPVMDGVALIEYLSSHYPEIKCLALSGYEDFNYVKESLKNGAIDYLLKHKVDSVSLLNVLNEARNKISQQHTFMEQLVESREILRQDFLKRLILGDICNKNIINKKVKELEPSLSSGPLLLAVVTMDGLPFPKKRYTKDEINRLLSNTRDVGEEIVHDMGNGILTFVDEGKFIILFHFGTIRSELYIYNHVSTTIKRIIESITRYLNHTVHFALSKIFHHIEEVSQIYKGVDRELSEKIMEEKDQLVSESSAMGNTIDFFNLDVQDEKQIMMAIRMGDMEKVNLYLAVIFEKILTLKVGYKAIQMICIELIGIANRIARESSINIKEIYNNNEIPYDEMKRHETIMDVKEWISGIYERLIHLLLGVDLNEKFAEATRKTLQYIRKNFTQDISLYQAAQDIGVNSSYLSRIFKEDCGTGFAEYLSSIRVEQAKYLMEHTDIKLKEIVKQVGFNNYTYFFKVFKLVTGKTPVEYKENQKDIISHLSQ